jgi:acyl-CoA reductase-like NAD-dependent aldehyde dehydrogenase
VIPPLLRKGDYIYGSFVKPESTNGFINDGNPGDRDDHIGRFPFSMANVKEAIAYAKAVQPAWGRKSLEDRLRPVDEFRKQIERRMRYIISVMTREVGLPSWEAHQELKETINLLEAMIGEAPAMLGQVRSEDSLSEFQRQPLGVAAMITPFSLSLQTPALFSAASILCGNTVVHNPSKYTPGIGQAIAELWDRSQLQRGVYNMVQGPGSHIGQCLLSSPEIDGLLFAGSHSIASEVRKKTAPSFPLVMHMGGKSTAIVLDDCEIESTTRDILSSACRATGQRPNSISRVIATPPIMEQLSDRLARSMDQISIGYGADRGVYIGPMVSEHWRTRYHRFGRSLLSGGHTAIRGTENKELEKRGFYVKPSLYRINWTNGSPMIDDEPPGPIILLYEASGLEEIISLHNMIAHRRMSSVFTDIHRPRLQGLLSRLQTGAVFVNQPPHELSMAACGQGKSSNGHAMGAGLLESMTQQRMICRPKPEQI